MCNANAQYVGHACTNLRQAGQLQQRGKHDAAQRDIGPLPQGSALQREQAGPRTGPAPQADMEQATGCSKVAHVKRKVVEGAPAQGKLVGVHSDGELDAKDKEVVDEEECTGPGCHHLGEEVGVCC